MKDYFVEREIFKGVFDPITITSLYKLIKKGYITKFLGEIGCGKEARTFIVESNDGIKLCKIYMPQTSFNNYLPYISGDYRFRRIPRNNRTLIYLWASKEFKNLELWHSNGFPVPEPYFVKDNILIMEFIGEGMEKALTLHEEKPKNPTKCYNKIKEFIVNSWNKVNLVHADLSEYNILRGDKPIIIDCAQSVLNTHPRALEFLERDCHNINKYFKNQEVTIDTSLFKSIKKIV